MILDTAVLSAGLFLQLVLLALLIHKQVSKQLPFFVFYNGLNLAFALMWFASIRLGPDSYMEVWMLSDILDSIFYFIVLLELVRSVLRFNRITAPPRWLIPPVFVLLVLAIWPAVQWQISLDNFSKIRRLALHLLQVTTVLQTAAFGTLVTLSSVVKLRWPIREFRIATGMGLWTVASLIALMLRNDGLVLGQYYWVDLIAPATVVIILAWWLHHFWFEPPQVKEKQDSPAFELAGSGADNQDGNPLNSASA